MSEYTAEDFAGASFARHADGGTARRARHGIWDAGRSGRKRDDEDMARGGWVPVVEATEVMQNRQIDAEAHLDQIERLSKRLSAAGDRIDRQLLALDDLREENYRLERILQAPLSLKDLEAAWEAAEVPTDDAPMQQGDVYISTVDRNDRGLGYLVAAAGRTGTHMHFNARILSRAPREPWQDLADELDDTPSCIANEALAQRLHAQGWRKTGGDDDE